MSYNAVPTVSTGDTWSAANHNTYIRDNFAAGVPDIFTAAGDIAYATAANAAVPLAIGSPFKYLKVNSDGDAPEWSDVNTIMYRQGGSSSDWNVPGTSDYPVTESIEQTGAYQFSLYGSTPGSVGHLITYPQKFSGIPKVTASVEKVAGSRYGVNYWVDTVTTSDFYGYIGSPTASSPTSNTDEYIFHWRAVGSIT